MFSYTDIILSAQNQIDAFTQSFTFKGYQALATYLQKPLGALCVLYIVLMGYAILFGYVKTPIDAFKKIVLRMGVIYMFAMSWSLFAQYFVALFIDVASDIGAVIMNANPINGSGMEGNGVNGALQNVLNEVIRVGQDCIDHASLRNWTPVFIGAIIEWAGMAVIGFAFFELMIAKMMLSVCLCFAPLFFIFTLFDQTRAFFDRWLGTLVGFALVFIFVSSIVGLCVHLLHMTIEPHLANHAKGLNFTIAAPILLMAALCIMLIFEVTGIAKSIGGACSSSHAGAMIGGFIGGAMGASRVMSKGGSLMKNTLGKAGNLAKLSTKSGFNAMKSIQNKMRGAQ